MPVLRPRLLGNRERRLMMQRAVPSGRIPSRPMQSDPGGVVRAYWERVWNDGDVDAIDGLIADPYIRHTAAGSAVRDHKQVRKDMARYLRAVYKADVTVEDLAVSGDRVWSRLTLRGVNVETEETMVISWLHVARVVDGLIVEAWNLNAPVDWTTKAR